MAKKQLKLKDTSGSFFDVATGFEVTREEVVDYPDNPGALTLEWIAKGLLIEFVPEKAGKAKAGEGEGGAPDPNANK